MEIAIKWIFFAAASAVLCSCSLPTLNRFEENSARTQSEAGSTHVAVLSITPVTDKVVTALKPAFKISGDSALKEVLPVTGSFQQQEVRSTNVAVDVKVTPNPTVGDAPQVQTPDQENLKAKVTPGVVSADGIKVDPFTLRDTAESLFYKVVVQNNSVADFPRQSGFTPYLVRMQVSVIPKKRGLPYDVSSLLNFFARCRARRLGVDTNAASQQPACPHRIALTKVIPIISPENLERSLDLASQDVLRSIEATGAGAIGNAALGGAFQNAARNVLSQIANTFNSLTNTGRVVDNQLFVKFGAYQAPNGSYQMVARKHDVLLFLLVPNGYDLLEVRTEQTMVHPRTGEEIPKGEGAMAFGQSLEAVVGAYRYVPKKGWPVCQLSHTPNSRVLSAVAPGARKMVDFARKRLRNDLASGDFDMFRKRFRDCIEKLDRTTEDPNDTKTLFYGTEDPRNEYEENAQVVWVGLSTIQAELSSAFVTIELPSYDGLKAAELGDSWSPPGKPSD